MERRAEIEVRVGRYCCCQTYCAARRLRSRWHEGGGKGIA